jgi:hypothetical protein
VGRLLFVPCSCRWQARESRRPRIGLPDSEAKVIGQSDTGFADQKEAQQ